MPLRTLILLAVAVLVAGVAWYLRDARQTDEEQVRALIREVIAAAEQKDVGAIGDALSDDFVAGTDGQRLDRRAALFMLTAEFRRRGPVVILATEIPVTVEGDRAHSSFDALLAEAGLGWSSLLPAEAGGWHLEVDARREGDGWAVVHVERSDALLMGGSE